MGRCERGGERGSSPCIVHKKRVTSCAYFCTFFFVRVFLVSFRCVLLVCLFFPPFCLLCIDFVLPVYIRICMKMYSTAAAFGFFSTSSQWSCLPVSVCVWCVLVRFLCSPSDAHLNSWNLADFIVFNETDSSRIYCSFFGFSCSLHTRIVLLRRRLSI